MTGGASVIDIHTHVFCWGEDPREGWMSERLRRSWLVRMLRALARLDREPGETMTEKIRARTLRHIGESRLDYAVVLAQDAVYREDGSRDDAGTHFYVSNDYVFRLAEEHPKVLAGAAINPMRRDAVAELERCRERGARLVKIHTMVQHVDPARPRFDAFYRRAAELAMPLMFHTGPEYACPSGPAICGDPARLARPLDHGVTVIAAHSGTSPFFARTEGHRHFVLLMRRYPNLYGDTAVLAELVRAHWLWRLEREPRWLRERLLHGSDYPLLPSALPFARRIGPLPPERRNPLDLDLRIKLAFDLGDGYATRACQVLDTLSAIPSAPPADDRQTNVTACRSRQERSPR